MSSLRVLRGPSDRTVKGSRRTRRERHEEHEEISQEQNSSCTEYTEYTRISSHLSRTFLLHDLGSILSKIAHTAGFESKNEWQRSRKRSS